MLVTICQILLLGGSVELLLVKEDGDAVDETLLGEGEVGIEADTWDELAGIEEAIDGEDERSLVGDDDKNDGVDVISMVGIMEISSITFQSWFVWSFTS